MTKTPEEKTWLKHNFPFTLDVPNEVITRVSYDGFPIIYDVVWNWLELEIGPVHDIKHGWSWDRNRHLSTIIFGFLTEEDAVLFKLTWL